MIDTYCAICEKDDSVELYSANFDPKKINERTFSARRPPDKIHYRIVKCKNCGLTYSNPILPPGKIENLYRKSTVTYEEQTENLGKTYGYYLMEVKNYLSVFAKTPPRGSRLATPPGWPHGFPGGGGEQNRRLLEIGCGNGFFLLKAKELGFQEVWGVEPGEDSVAKADESIKKNIIVEAFRPKLFRTNFFDVVCMFQTLDHLVDPNQALTECWRILKKGGVIMVIVHDASSWSARLLGEASPIIDIEHTYLFDKKTLPMLFSKHKFKIVEVFDVVNIHALGYWVFLFPLPGFIKRLSLALLDTLGIGKLPIKLRAGNIGLVAHKPYWGNLS